MPNALITRFAPSPTGHLHLGHAYSALLAYNKAKETGGNFILRIEDIDPVRCKDHFIDDLKDDLHWLGIAWEEPVRRQSEHLADYQKALDHLREQGLIYPCFCTRREIEAEAAASAHAPHLECHSRESGNPQTSTNEIIYPGTCRNLSAQERKNKMAGASRHVLRLDIEKACALAGPLTWHDEEKGQITARPEDFGDVVLARKDVPTSYHLSVTVDDHLQGITLVTRGEDLFRSTDIHRLLQKLLGYKTPDYHHHKLLVNESGKRFAKRDHAKTLRALRTEGKTAEGIKRMIGF